MTPAGDVPHDDVAGPATQDEGKLEATDQAKEPAGQLVGGVSGEELLDVPEIPVTGQARTAIAAIDADSLAKAQAVSEMAAERRKNLQEWFNEVRTGLTATFQSTVAGFNSFLAQVREETSGALLAAIAEIRAGAENTITQATVSAQQTVAQLGMRAAQRSASALASVQGAADRIIAIARSIPVPNLPGISSIWQRILATAQEGINRLRTALAGVQLIIQEIVNAAVSAVNSAIASISQMLMSVVQAILDTLAQIVAQVDAILVSFQSRVNSILQSVLEAALALLNRIEQSLVNEIDKAEKSALAELEISRTGGKLTIIEIIEFGYAHGDYPADDGVSGLMDAVAASTSAEEFEAAIVQAMDFVVKQAMDVNADILREFDAATSSVVTLAISSVSAWLDEIVAALSAAYSATVEQVSNWARQLWESVSNFVSELISGFTAAVELFSSNLSEFRQTVDRALENPIDSLMQGISSVTESVSSFFQRLIGRLTSGDDGSAGGIARPSLAPLGSGQANAAVVAAAPAIPIVGGGVAIGTIIFLDYRCPRNHRCASAFVSAYYVDS